MEIRYCTFWRRVGAGLVDTIILLPILLFAVYISEQSSHWIASLFLISCPLLYYVYNIYFHGKYGQTLGKMVFKVTVMDISETRAINFKQAFLRDSVPLFLTVVFILYEVIQILNGSYSLQSQQSDKFVRLHNGINEIWAFLEIITMLFNSERRAVHDFIAGSVVVRTEELDRP